MHRICETIAIGYVWLCLCAPWCDAESLEEAWIIASASNAALAAANSETAAAEWELQASRSLGSPNATLHSGYTFQSDTPSFQSPSVGLPSFPYAQRQAAAASAELRIPLFTHGRIQNAISAAQAQLGVATSDNQKARLDLLLQVGEAYFAVLRDQRECEVAEQEVTALQAHEKEVASHFQQNRVPRNDLLTAQVTTAQAVQYQQQRQFQLNNSRAAYNRLLGRHLHASFELEECSLPWLSHTMEQLAEIAWQQNPELSSIRAAADAKYFESQRLLAERKPQISAVGGFEYNENRFQSPQTLASAAVVVDWSLYDGGQKKYKAQAELARAARFQRLLVDLQSQLQLEILTFLNAREEAAKRRELAVQTLVQAEENLRVSNLRYAQGCALNTDVLDAQIRQTQVKRDFYYAGYDLAVAQLRLRRVTGILPTYPVSPP